MTWRDQYKVHPAADVFPMMSDQELAELGEDIGANGLHNPIILWRDADGGVWLVDGRNRLEAMERRGRRLTPSWGEAKYCKRDPVDFIIGLNIHRRHLTKQQRADLIVAAVRASRQLGEVPKRHVKGKPGSEKDAQKAKAVAVAKDHGISKRTIERAFEKASDHPNAPIALRHKAARQRSKAASRSRMAPATVEGWRCGYINACSIGCPNLDAELKLGRMRS